MTEDHRLELTYQHLEESTVRTDDFFTGTTPQVTGLNTFYISGTESDYYSARLYSQWSDNFSTEVRYSRLGDPGPSGSGRRRRGPVGQSDPAHHRRHRQSRPESTRPFSPARARRAPPTICRPRSTLFRAVANYDAGDHQLKGGVEINHADIFNLFVQNATGTLVFRNAADLRGGPAVAGPWQQPDQHVADQRHQRPHRRRVRQRLRDRRHQRCRRGFHPHHLFGLRAGHLAGLGSAERHRRHPLRLVLRRQSGPQQRTSSTATAFPTIRGSTTSAASSCRASPSPTISTISRSSRAARSAAASACSRAAIPWSGSATPSRTTAASAPWARPRPPAARPARSTCVTGGQFTGVPECFRAAAQATAAAGQGFTQSVDPDIEQPTVFRANLGFQTYLDFTDTGFFGGWRLNLDYIYSHYNDPYTIVDLSQVPDPSIGPQRLHHRRPADLPHDRSRHRGLHGQPRRYQSDAGLRERQRRLLHHRPRGRAHAHQRRRL